MEDIITLLDTAGIRHRVEESREDFYINIRRDDIDSWTSCPCFHPTPYDAYLCVWEAYINGTYV